MTDPLVTIIIPTWNNNEYLSGALSSLLRNQGTPGLMRILVVNNGHENSCDWVNHKQVTVLQTGGQNLGWEGGIELGLKNTTSPFVCFFNDDAFIPPSSRLWLNQLLQHMRDPRVGAVGPSSNVVMGAQNIFLDMQVHVMQSTFLIGFCVLVRREAFVKIGGMDQDLPGGDDLDWSIRLRDAGYKLIIDRTVLVYHHGFKTGNRVMGDHQTAGGWNSYEMQEQTTHALIKKHGLKKWWETIRSQVITGDTGHLQGDLEGELIAGLVTGKDKMILDLGCGPRKTLKRAIGVDFVKKGENIKTLESTDISEADVEADVSKNIPFDKESVDVIIARHILEHMVDPISVLALWISKLKKGGRLILALPNEAWHLTIPMNFEHVHAYTPESATVLLQTMGLKVKQVLPSGNNISFIVEAEKI